MELGKTKEVELTSNTETTWLIKLMYESVFRDSKIDTIILKNIYTVWKGKRKKHFPGEIGYGISLLLQLTALGNERPINTNITFTKLKMNTGIPVHVNNKIEHSILKPIAIKIKEMEDLEKGEEIIIPFDKSIVLNAQGNDRNWGVTNRYYFVGMRVWRFV